MISGTSDALFAFLERSHLTPTPTLTLGANKSPLLPDPISTRNFGHMLDAGTGLNSLKWIQSLPTDSWTAITADVTMQNQILKDTSIASKMRQCDRVSESCFFLQFRAKCLMILLIFSCSY